MDVLTIKRGDDDGFAIVFTNEDGTPMNLTGCVVWFTMRQRAADVEIKDDADAPIHKEYTELTATDGIVDVELSNTDTDIESGEYLAEVQIKDAVGKIKSSAIFEVVIEDDITRAR